jgi:hypothetical protein
MECYVYASYRYRGWADWPTAGFFRELYAAYPTAKFILTYRSSESWVDSLSATICKLLAEDSEIPEEMHDWLDMCSGVVACTNNRQEFWDVVPGNG